MSIMLDEAQAYENSRDYDCCQIIEGAYTVGDAVYEAYCDGREALPTNAEIEAVAKRLCWNSYEWDGIDSYAAKDRMTHGIMPVRFPASRRNISDMPRKCSKSHGRR